jgi:rod shape-determining protein MreC
VATFGTGLGRPLPGRGPSPGFRFTLYAIVSVVCMFLDQRESWLQSARFALQGAVYPLQLAVNSPSAAWTWTRQVFESREKLQAENAELRQQKRELELRTIRYAALAQENAQLRGLAKALPAVTERWLAAEVVSVELDSLRQRLLINRGSRNGVFKGQAVLSDDGLLGQTTRVGPWSSEIILITDPEHAVPVQIERTGLRTIAVGAGSDPTLELPYLPANADIQQGDLLLTSGLGGVFPAGFPVARVTDVRRDAGGSYAEVQAEPRARLDDVREVVLVWFRADHPAAPATLVAGQASAGNPAIQPQPRPAPPATAQSQPQAAAPALAAQRGSEARAAPPRARERRADPQPDETPAPQTVQEAEPQPDAAEPESAEQPTQPETREEFVPMPDTTSEAPPEDEPVPERGDESA